jgi:hypothetical protein
MERAARGLPPDKLLSLFERGFAAMWQRALLTLGDVTLTAIVDRVLYTATEQFPMLSPLKLEATGLRWQGPDEHAGSLDHHHLAAGIQFVLVEFLTVLGNLTAEILTPALHSELSKVGPDEGQPQKSESSLGESER